MRAKRRSGPVLILVLLLVQSILLLLQVVGATTARDDWGAKMTDLLQSPFVQVIQVLSILTLVALLLRPDWFVRLYGYEDPEKLEAKIQLLENTLEAERSTARGRDAALSELRDSPRRRAGRLSSDLHDIVARINDWKSRPEDETGRGHDWLLRAWDEAVGVLEAANTSRARNLIQKCEQAPQERKFRRHELKQDVETAKHKRRADARMKATYMAAAVEWMAEEVSEDWFLS